MSISDWRYYNHAAIPTTAPHEVPDTSVIESGEIWKSFAKAPLLARWTTDFDCPDETDWWYVIKDEPFDISAIKAKKRYVIKKGLENFDVRLICASDYKEALFNVHIEAVNSYPPSQRIIPTKEGFFNSVDAWSDYLVFAAFSKEDGELAAYATVIENGSYYSFASMKSIPAYEKLQVNAAVVFTILEHLSCELAEGRYICDGERNINHETGFQDYLISYFGFRKAYARMHLSYKPSVGWIVKLAYPIRGFIKRFDKINIVHKLMSVLQMEEIVRKQK